MSPSYQGSTFINVLNKNILFVPKIESALPSDVFVSILLFEKLKFHKYGVSDLKHCAVVLGRVEPFPCR